MKPRYLYHLQNHVSFKMLIILVFPEYIFHNDLKNIVHVTHKSTATNKEKKYNIFT